MKCRYCGQEIPDGILYCENCGQEVQMVPDYNPLDDMLTAHVKDSINGDLKLNNERTVNGTGASARRATGRTTAVRGTTGRTAAMRGTTGRTAAMRGATGRTAAMRGGTSQNTAGRRIASYSDTARMRDEREMRRRQTEKRKALKRKKRRKVLLMLFLIFAALIAGGIALYMNSYTGIVRSGNSALASGEYTKAEEKFLKAIAKNKKKPDAYEGLSKIYIEKDDLTKAENIFLNALDQQPKNTELYKACFQFYLDTRQAMEIPNILSDVDDNVKDKLSEYVVEEPTFSLDEEKYDDVQQLTLSSAEGKVLYTMDGSEPTMSSDKFKSPIQISEGTTTIKAVTVNKQGVPSQTVTKEYVVEFPIEDAPAVSPSTGQYETAQMIEVKIPEGYDAYYTMDGNDPTIASQKYTGPIEMPDGETLFKAILVTKSGRVSGVTTRNYVRN